MRQSLFGIMGGLRTVAEFDRMYTEFLQHEAEKNSRGERQLFELMQYLPAPMYRLIEQQLLLVFDSIVSDVHNTARTELVKEAIAEAEHTLATLKPRTTE